MNEYTTVQCRETDKCPERRWSEVTHSGLNHRSGGNTLALSEESRLRAILTTVLMTMESYGCFEWIMSTFLGLLMVCSVSIESTSIELLNYWLGDDEGMCLQPNVKLLAKLVLDKFLSEAEIQHRGKHFLIT
jgi:hypothetical protein